MLFWSFPLSLWRERREKSVLNYPRLTSEGVSFHFNPPQGPFSFTLGGKFPHTRFYDCLKTTCLVAPTPFLGNFSLAFFFCVEKKKKSTKSAGWSGVLSVIYEGSRWLPRSRLAAVSESRRGWNLWGRAGCPWNMTFGTSLENGCNILEHSIDELRESILGILLKRGKVVRVGMNFEENSLKKNILTLLIYDNDFFIWDFEFLLRFHNTAFHWKPQNKNRRSMPSRKGWVYFSHPQDINYEECFSKDWVQSFGSIWVRVCVPHFYGKTFGMVSSNPCVWAWRRWVMAGN